MDKKKLVSINSLLAISFIYAYRVLGEEKYLEEAHSIYDEVLLNYFDSGKLFHSRSGEKYQRKEFLEDFGSFFLLATYIFEELRIGKDIIELLYKRVSDYKKPGIWYQNLDGDFEKVIASNHDHPYPSGIALTELAILRYDILIETAYNPHEYNASLDYDFFNLMAFFSQGYLKQVISYNKLDWSILPINSIQLKSKFYKICYKGSCKIFENQADLSKQFS